MKAERLADENYFKINIIKQTTQFMGLLNYIESSF